MHCGKKITSWTNFEKFYRNIMSPDSGKDLLEVEKGRVEVGFGERRFVDFVLEVSETLGGTATFSKITSKERKDVIQFQKSEEPVVENLLG